MNIASKLTMTLAFTAVAAFANDHLMQIRDHARGLEQEFRGMKEIVNSKPFRSVELESRVATTAAGVDKLKGLWADFEASNPHLTKGEDWKTAKEMVALIDMFHAQKSQLLGPDAHKKRGLLANPAKLCVVRGIGLGWSDLGEPDRVRAALEL